MFSQLVKRLGSFFDLVVGEVMGIIAVIYKLAPML
jgi:hypothetical protein